MTFTVKQIEKELATVIWFTGHSHGWKTTIAMLLDYAAMKRREAESVPVGYSVPQAKSCQDGSMEEGPDYFVYANEASEYEERIGVPVYTSPPSQPSTGVPDLKTLAYDRGTKLALDWIKQAEEASARNERTRAQNLWQCSDELNATLQAASPRSP